MLISNLGTWMQRTAQDWIVLTELTDYDAFALGVTTALQFAPQLLLSGPAGLIADRADRRVYLLYTQSTMALLGIALAVAALLGALTFELMCAFALALGVVNALDLPARQSFATQLVQRDDVSNAIALNTAVFNVARIGGPALAGVLLTVVGAGWVFALNGATFLAVIVGILFIKPAQIHSVRKASGRRQLRAGLAYIGRRADLVFLMTSMFAFGALGFNFPIFTTTMASIAFGQGPAAFGILTSALGLGSIAGALIVASRPRARLRLFIVAAHAFSVASAIAAIAPTLLTFALALVALGLTAITLTAASNAYVQSNTAEDFRGRVISTYFAVFTGASVLGAPAVGWVANVWGPRWALGVASLTGVIITAIALSCFTNRTGTWTRRWPGESDPA